MFPIDVRNLFIANPDFPLIVGDYEVLHYDEMPILFTGITRYQARVIGSSVEEDMHTDRFFHLIVSADTYSSFIRRRISYRDVILQSGGVFVVDRATSDNRNSVYWIPVTSIPEELIPLEDSYCPEISIGRSLVFDASLRGKRADFHQAYPGDVRAVENSLSGVVSDALISVSATKDIPQTLISPYMNGSFRIRLSVEEPAPSEQVGFTDALRPEYALLYVDFCLNRFQDEIDSIVKDSLGGAPYFCRLLDMYKRIGFFSDIAKDGGFSSESAVRERLLAAVRKSADRLSDLAEVIGGNFTSLDIFSVDDSDESLIGTFDADSAARISDSIGLYDVTIGGQSEDAEPKQYELLVYNLNAETRKGSAYLIQGESMPRVRISISGSSSLNETPFTESLDKNIKIKVMGKAKSMLGKITSIRIEFA